MKPGLRLATLLVLMPLLLMVGLYLSTGGTLEKHFHASLADRTQQASIHREVVNSGFHLRQAIDTSRLNTARANASGAPVCLWLRIEYPRRTPAWGSNGTVLFRLSTSTSQWTASMRSEDIKSYFQPVCFAGSSTDEVADKTTHLDVSVAEPDLEKVAFFAMGPANGLNNAVVNGRISNHTLTYRLTANIGMQRKDAIQLLAIFVLGFSLLLTVWIPAIRKPSAAGLNLN